MEMQPGTSVEKLLTKITEVVPEQSIEKIREAVVIIHKTLKEYSLDEIGISFNGGKDCTVLLHLIYLVILEESSTIEEAKRKLGTILTIYFESPAPFQEVDNFMQYAAKRYELNIRKLNRNIKEGLRELMDTTQVRAIFMGTRRTDPFCDTLRPFSPTDEGWPQIMRVNPLIDWNYHDIWIFIRSINLSYCSLYDRGYTSIGSTYNTNPNPSLKRPNSDTYYPAYLLLDANLERAGR